MNATANATASIRRRPMSIPNAIDIDQIPALQRRNGLDEILPFPMVAGDKISVKLLNYRGELDSYGRKFTLGSVAEYTARYNGDVDAAIARAKDNGHNLYYAIAEGIVISAHREIPVPRLELELGTIIEMDGQRFQILQSPNDNLQLVPLP